MDFSPEFRSVYRRAVENGWAEESDIGGTYMEEVMPDEVRHVVTNDIPQYIIEDATNAGLRCIKPKQKALGPHYFSYVVMCREQRPGSPWVLIRAEFTYDSQTWEVVLQRLSAKVIKNSIITVEGEL